MAMEKRNRISPTHTHAHTHTHTHAHIYMYIRLVRIYIDTHMCADVKLIDKWDMVTTYIYVCLHITQSGENTTVSDRSETAAVLIAEGYTKRGTLGDSGAHVGACIYVPCRNVCLGQY